MFDPQEKVLLVEAFAEYHHILIAALPSEEDMRRIELSDHLEKRMNRLLYHQKQFYFGLVNTVAKRVACILLVIFLAATTVTFSVESLRETVINFIIETFEKGSTILFSKNGGDVSNEIQFVTPKLPSYIPEGYELVVDLSDEIEVCLIYEGEGENSFQFLQFSEGSKRTVNTEGVVYKTIRILNIYEGIAFQNKGENYLIFNDNEYMYLITGSLSEEELLKIAESIPFGKK